MTEKIEKVRLFGRIKKFLLTTIIGGFLVVLPLGLLVAIVQFLVNFLRRVLSPMRGLISFSPNVETWLIDLISFLVIILAFFVIGLIVRTGVGRRVHSVIENRILKQIPFYSTLRNTVQQFVGRKKMPFSQVVIADVMNTKMTGFVTDEHPDGTYTIFVPTAPNPTNGFVFHVDKAQLRFLSVRAEDAMRTVVGMGTGSAQLFEPTEEEKRPPRKKRRLKPFDLFS